MSVPPHILDALSVFSLTRLCEKQTSIRLTIENDKKIDLILDSFPGINRTQLINILISSAIRGGVL
jgi:hypothetical protein